MSDKKIDEEHIKAIKKVCCNLFEAITLDLNILTNIKEDVFRRYMSYSRLVSILDLANFGIKHQQNNFRIGFDLNDEFFNTEKYKESGWDKDNLEGNPFFIDENKVSLDEIVSSEFAEKIKDKMREIIQESKNHTNK